MALWTRRTDTSRSSGDGRAGDPPDAWDEGTPAPPEVLRGRYRVRPPVRRPRARQAELAGRRLLLARAPGPRRSGPGDALGPEPGRPLRRRGGRGRTGDGHRPGRGRPRRRRPRRDGGRRPVRLQHPHGLRRPRGPARRRVPGLRLRRRRRRDLPRSLLLHPANDPRERGAGYRRDVEVTNVLPVPGGLEGGPRTYRVQWDERESSPREGVRERSWEGYLSVTVSPPTSTEALERNPLGVYVTDLSWSPLAPGTSSPPTPDVGETAEDAPDDTEPPARPGGPSDRQSRRQRRGARCHRSLGPARRSRSRPPWPWPEWWPRGTPPPRWPGRRTTPPTSARRSHVWARPAS